MKRGCLMPDQSTPEIDRLNEIAHRPDKRSVTQWTPLVALPDAIQAVRDTEAKYQALVDAAGAARFFAGCSRQPCPTCDPSGEGTEIAGEVYGRLDAALNALGTDRIAD